MKNKIIKGVSVLVVANLIGKLLGMVYRIPLASILGAEGMGLYQMVFPVYAFALIIITGGLPTVLSKLVAESRAEKRYDKTYNLFNNTFIICLIMGFCFAIAFFFLGEKIAFLQGNKNASDGYFAISIAIFFASMCAAIKGYFQGFEDMKPTAISVIIEQGLKFLFGLVFSLSFINKGINNAVFGAVLGMAVAEFFSFLFLSLFFISHKKKYVQISFKKENYYKKIIKMSVSFTLMALITPLTTLLESFFTINILSTYFTKAQATSLYGIQTGMINPIINFPLVLISCLTIALLPKLSYDMRAKINTSISIKNCYKFVWIFVIACTFGYLAVNTNALMVLFPKVTGEQFEIAKKLFIISSFSIIFLSIAQLSTTIMQAKGKIYTPVLNLTVASIIKIVLAIILLYNSKYNILALAFAYTFSNAIYCILNLFSIKENFNLGLKLKTIILPLFAGFFMFVICGFAIKLLNGVNMFLSLGVAIVLGVVVYFALLFMFGVVDKEEISILLNKTSQN